MIDGLKVTMTGEELRAHFAGRIAMHQRTAEMLQKDLKDPECQLPEHILEYEVERARERAAVLAFMREHIVELEVYLLGKTDLEFAELVPEEEPHEHFMPCYMYRR
jgi:hypothetical protein